ncbi:MAG TPA: EAL domain-containing protein [Acidimicrobiales bacterium]|nr:EAL domain-containing protein [Acidimicrobiales bacterium]
MVEVAQSTVIAELDAELEAENQLLAALPGPSATGAGKGSVRWATRALDGHPVRSLTEIPGQVIEILTRSRAMSSQLWWQFLAGVLVLVYCGSLVEIQRPVAGYLWLWDGWVGNIAAMLPIIPIVLRIRHVQKLRAGWIAIAVGIALHALASVVFILHDQNLHPIPSPAPSDLVYLASYAALIVGVVMLTQAAFGRGHLSVRLDGVVAGMASGAALALWFEPLLDVTRFVNMAYPLCDLVLLMVMIAGFAPGRYRLTWSTGLLVVGVVWFVVGDLFYLNQIHTHSAVQGRPLHGTWALAFWVIGIAAWGRQDRRTLPRRPSSLTPAGIALVPVVFGFMCLALLAMSMTRLDTLVASALSLAGLGVVLVRMALTLRELRRGADNFRDARTDQLTGLQNRRAFLEDAEAKLSTAHGAKHVGFLLVDLDGFKEINDSLGHHCGDELLQIVARRFQRKIDDKGSVARLGGDEFASTCVVSSSQELVEVAQDLAETLFDPISLDGVTVRVGASIGVSISPDHGISHSDLLRSADVAMYEAKRSRSIVCVYHPDHDLNSRERLELIDDLRTAINTRTLHIHFQPTLHLLTEKVIGVEALVRWHHPVHGLLQPDSFVPLAERVGLIPQLTRAVLELAIAEAAALDRRGYPLQMSVNISRFDLVDEDLPAFIDDLLEQHDVAHNRLTLEVTESCIGADPERAKRSIHELRARGIRISIDDFGVGYSSMSQLLELPIDELKIDKSFVLALEDDERARAIISSTVELARALKLVTVAEGAEKARNLNSLAYLGVDVVQGFIIAQPLTSRELLKFLEDFDRKGLPLAPVTG